MTNAPKIVIDRLRAARPDQTHPDADLLTAFAEQALSETEREGVLEHLTLCGDCREVIVVALPAADIEIADVPVAAETDAVRTKPRQAKPEGSWLNTVWPRLARPNLRWAALAAGVVVAASLVLTHPGKLNQQQPPSANRQSSIASTSGSTSASTSSASDSELAASSVPTPSREANSDGPLADNKKEAARAGKPPAATGLRPSPETLMARNDWPPIEKAKPAPPSTATLGSDTNEQQKTGTLPGADVMSGTGFSSSTGPALAQRNSAFTWTIVGGVLQRSRDSGQSWQNALHSDHPLLCYGSEGDDVWAGGKVGTLFHSTNNGESWVQVHPSIEAQQLIADITRIDVRGTDLGGTDLQGDPRSATQIVVSTSNNEVWSSADGGKTWQKN